MQTGFKLEASRFKNLNTDGQATATVKFVKLADIIEILCFYLYLIKLKNKHKPL